jgi:hypothetical protein
MATRRHISKELRPVKPSQQLKRLHKFFPEGRGRLEGVLEAGLLGPGAPELREHGRFGLKWIMDGVFGILTYDVYLYDGAKKTDRSQGHCVMGWDTNAGEYRMLRAANLGVLFQMSGDMKGNRLVFTSDERTLKGQRTKVRYTFIRERPNETVWIAELSTRGGPWKVVGKDTLIYS